MDVEDFWSISLVGGVYKSSPRFSLIGLSRCWEKLFLTHIMPSLEVAKF
jgi:hypothetical protein